MSSKVITVLNRDVITRSDQDELLRFNLYLNGVLAVTDGWDNWDGSAKSHDYDPELTNIFKVYSVWETAGQSTLTSAEYTVIAIPFNINLEQV